MPVPTIKKNAHPSDITINQLTISPINRQRKDIASWHYAQVSAEAVYSPNRSRLYDLYADVVLDGHLSGIIAKRIDAILNKDIYFEKDNKQQKSMDALIGSYSFRELLRTIMQTQLWGISGLEFLPGDELSFQKIPRKHIKPNLGIISYEQNGQDGIPYADLANIWVMGEPDDLGVLMKCAPYYLYKRGGLADWAEYIELFGQPVRVVKYDAYDEQTKVELRRVLEESGSSLALMIPRQADFEMKDGKQTNGDGRLQLSFIRAMNEELSVIVLGNTETTTSSPGSGYAQSKTHQQEQYEITRSDMAYVTAMLNSPHFLAILRSYGYPVAGGRFVFSRNMDIDYLKDRLAIDKKVAGIVPVPDDYWYTMYGIPKPDDKN